MGLAHQTRATAARRFRYLVLYHTGIPSAVYDNLPKEIKAAVRDYVERKQEPRSPHGGMYGLIKEQFGFLWEIEERGRGVEL